MQVNREVLSCVPTNSQNVRIISGTSLKAIVESQSSPAQCTNQASFKTRVLLKYL